MSIRIKTMIVIFLTFLTLLGIFFFTSRWFLLHDAIVSEEGSTTRDVTRLLAAVDDQIEVMDSIVGDWAPWDDTFAFINSGDPAYIASNLSDATFTNLGVELMLFINNSGQIVFGKMIDLESGAEIPIPESLTSELQVGSRLLSQKDPADKLAGILPLPDGALIISSQPISTSQGEGPMRGTLIMGRRLDEAEISKLSQRTLLSISVFIYNDPALADDVALARNALVGGKPIIITPQSETVVSGYTLVNDVYGDPALILRIDSPREAITQAKISLRYLGLALLGSGAVLGLVTLILLERMVIFRLTTLSSSVLKIGSQGTSTSRVEVNGNDEIFGLATSVNTMLDSLENSRAKERESQEHFRSLYENATFGIFRTTPDGHILMANPALINMLGYDSFEELSLCDLKAEGCESKYPRLEFLERIEQDGTLSGSVSAWERKDGSIFFVRESAHLIQDENNQPLYYEGTVEDITERKTAEDALRKSESSLQAVLRSTADGILAVGSINEVLYANDRFSDLWRIPQAVMASQDDSILLRHVLEQLSDPQSFLDKVQELYKSKNESFDTLNFKDGRVFERLSRPLLQGEVIQGRVWSFRDISERKQAEEALRQSEAELRALFASMQDVVLVIDREGVYRKIAPTHHELWVSPPEHMLGKTLRDVFPPEQAGNYINVVQQVLETKQSMQIEYDRVIGDRTVQFEASISPMTEDSTLWVAHDISGRKRNELIQDAIYRITQTAITSAGIDALYHSIHAILGELIPAENFYIALYDPLKELISFPYYIDQFDEPPPAPTPLQGLTGYVIRTGRPLLAPTEVFDRLVRLGEVEAVGTTGEDWMGAPLIVERRMIGVMAVQSYSEGIHFNQDDLSLLEFVSTQVAQAIERKRMEEEIRSLSMTDELTGLYNRRGFTMLAEQELKLAHRKKRRMLLFFGDVDDLKAINDAFGHAQGDLALKEVSAILKEIFRVADIPARIGGDEFVVLAVDASRESAETIANRMQAALERRNQQGDQPYQLTLSMGIVPYDPEVPCSVSELVAQADGVMYQRKQARKGK